MQPWALTWSPQAPGSRASRGRHTSSTSFIPSHFCTRRPRRFTLRVRLCQLPWTGSGCPAANACKGGLDGWA